MTPRKKEHGGASRSACGKRVLVALWATTMLACGGGESLSPGSTAHRERNAQALEMTLRRPDGTWIHIGDLRGQPVLLFIFATWDGMSQAALRPLTRFARRHEDVAILAVAAQPDAEMLTDPYERALRPPFPVTFDPERRVHEGTSPLGNIQTIPTFIMLDAYGVEVERHIGFPNTNTLPRLREAAIARGGIGEHEAPPTIGISR